MKNYLECVNNKSSKFYELELSFNSVITKHGKIGGEVIVYIYYCDNEKDNNNEEAIKLYNDIFKAKINKGYQECIKKEPMVQLKFEFQDCYYYNDDLFSIKELKEFQDLEW